MQCPGSGFKAPMVGLRQTSPRGPQSRLTSGSFFSCKLARGLRPPRAPCLETIENIRNIFFDFWYCEPRLAASWRRRAGKASGSQEEASFSAINPGKQSQRPSKYLWLSPGRRARSRPAGWFACASSLGQRRTDGWFRGKGGTPFGPTSPLRRRLREEAVRPA